MSIVKQQNKTRELRTTLSKSAIAQELAEAKRKLNNANRNNKRLKEIMCERQVKYDVDIQELKNEVTAKNETISALENEKLCLQEALGVTKSHCVSVIISKYRCIKPHEINFR